MRDPVHFKFGIESMIVYHFLSAQYALDDINKRHLKIAQLDDLNDPFELVSLELSDKSLRKVYRGFIKDMAQRFGVICFSKDWSRRHRYSA